MESHHNVAFCAPAYKVIVPERFLCALIIDFETKALNRTALDRVHGQFRFIKANYLYFTRVHYYIDILAEGKNLPFFKPNLLPATESHVLAVHSYIIRNTYNVNELVVALGLNGLECYAHDRYKRSWGEIIYIIFFSNHYCVHFNAFSSECLFCPLRNKYVGANLARCNTNCSRNVRLSVSTESYRVCSPRIGMHIKMHEK